MKRLKSTKGFTLVELIVVIAILAVLAGVAVPAYKGYVEKANLSADDQLLGHVNKAFASACAVNGTDNYAIANGTARLEWNDQEVVGVVVDTIPVANAISESFDEYFETDDAEFRILTEADIEFKDGVFTCDTAVVGFAYNGVYINVSKEDAEALKNSTFGKIGTDGLLDQINNVTDLAALLVKNDSDNALAKIFGSDDFKAAAMKALGATTEEEYQQKAGALMQQMIANGTATDMKDAEAKLSANAAVLYAAKNAGKYDSDQIAKLFDGSTTKSDIVSKLNSGDSAGAMSDATLIYGMYYAYANSDKADPNKKYDANNPAEVLNAFEDDKDFRNYVNSDAGKKDMNAYLASLNMINDAADTDTKVVEDLMLNGFNNANFKNGVAGIIK